MESKRKYLSRSEEKPTILRASSPIWATEASLARTRDRGAFYSAPRGLAARSRVLARLVSLAQIGELVCRLEPTLRIFCKEVSILNSLRKQPTFLDATTGLISQGNDIWVVKQIFPAARTIRSITQSHVISILLKGLFAKRMEIV